MNNYIKSEFYRYRYNRKLMALVLIFAGLMAASVLVLSRFVDDPTFAYANTRFALGNIYMAMNMICGVAVLIAGFMFDNEDQNKTLKHAVAFGIDRKAIYLARFFVMAVLSVAIYTVLTTAYVGLAFALLPASHLGEVAILIRVSLGSCGCLLAILALSHALLMTMDNKLSAYAISLVFVFVLPRVLGLLATRIDIFKSAWAIMPTQLLGPSGPLLVLSGSGTRAIIICNGIGLLWILAFSVLGCRFFDTKEIR